MYNNFISYNQYKKDYVLNETYESYVELKKLVVDIKAKYFIKDFVENEIYYIKDIYKNDINNFKVIKNFVNADIGIIYTSKILNMGDGSFMFPEDYEEYGKEILRETDDKLLQKYPLGILVIGMMHSTILLHELQHAYDYYRSRGKMNKSKNMNKYNEKLKQMLNKTISSEDFASFYYKSQPELSSYFIQTINSLNLSRGNINDLYQEFKKNFNGYNYLTPKIKKSLTRKFFQYYHKIKETSETS